MSDYTDLRDVAHALGRCYEAEGHDCSPAGITDILARVEELSKIEREHAELGETMTIDSWHEDNGAALWWKFPVAEPPYCGTPLDDDFPDYVTHWTRLPEPPAGSVRVVGGRPMSTFDVVSFPPHYRPLPPGYIVVRTDDHYQWLKLTPDGRDYTMESAVTTDRYVARRGAFLHAAKSEDVQR